MKLVTSIFLMSYFTYGSVIVIGHENNFAHAKIVKSTFTNKYRIPSSLIRIQNHCTIQKNRIVICINKRKDFKVLQKNKELISSLQIFNRPF